MSVTESLNQALQNEPTGVTVIETIELDHVTFEQPIRIACGLSDDIDLPLSSGDAPVTFTAVPVEVTPPGMTQDGPTQMKLRIGNVSSLILPYAKDATQATDPVSVTYRAYRDDDLSEPGEVITGLQLRRISLSPAWAEGVVTFPEIELQAFPLFTYSQTLYPTLQQD